MLPDVCFYYDGKSHQKLKKKNKTPSIELKSITKLFVIFVLIWLYRKGLIKFTDPVSKYLPKFKHKKVKIIDIINHTSGLQNDWFRENPKTKKFEPTPLAKKYFKAKNIYEFSMKLKMVPKDYGKFKYNNYGYDVLGALIMKLTGKTHVQLLRKIFPEAKFKSRYAAGKLPFTTHSLFIYTRDFDYLAKKIIEYDFYTDILKHHLAKHIVEGYLKDISNVLPKEKWIGHSGSGGQLLLISPTEVFMSFSYGNSDLHKRGLSEEDSYKLLKKIKSAIK